MENYWKQWSVSPERILSGWSCSDLSADLWISSKREEKAKDIIWAVYGKVSVAEAE